MKKQKKVFREIENKIITSMIIKVLILSLYNINAKKQGGFCE